MSTSTDSHNKKRRVMVGAIGKCVHNLGVEGFADWLHDLDMGYISVKLGPAVPIPEVINKIREALERIDDGTFGTCELCGEEISEGRLKARAVTTLCIDCKIEEERKEKLP